MNKGVTHPLTFQANRLKCFTPLAPERRDQVPIILRSRPTSSWFLFTAEGSSMPDHDWTHTYRLELYAKARLWIVTYADIDTRAAKIGRRQVATWCEAGPDGDPAEVTTALLCAWRDACLKYGGPGIEFYHDYGKLDLPYDQFRVAYNAC
jgi:hypothetical protein